MTSIKLSFPKSWYPLCRSSELKPRQILKRKAFGDSWAVFRTERGQLGAVQAQCIHMGADLSRGRVVGERLQCPLHEWEYNASGVCEHIPAESVVPARARQVSSLRNPPRIPRPSLDVEDRLLDRLDPATQLERLSRFLWRRRRLATLRGQWMYFYTELPRGNGLAGVNVNTGLRERAIRISDLDERFISDEAASLLYSSKDNQLRAYSLNSETGE